jgi:hypothetical protein
MAVVIVTVEQSVVTYTTAVSIAMMKPRGTYTLFSIVTAFANNMYQVLSQSF